MANEVDRFRGKYLCLLYQVDMPAGLLIHTGTDNVDQFHSEG